MIVRMQTQPTLHFNPRSPWGERPHVTSRSRATVTYFNPRSPWGERRPWSAGYQTARHFNPRSPWGERRYFLFFSFGGSIFQSSLPVGGATKTKAVDILGERISILAPRGGSDAIPQLMPVLFKHFNPRSPWGERLPSASITLTTIADFNPRSPWGERPWLVRLALSISPFQSSLPVGGAT